MNGAEPSTADLERWAEKLVDLYPQAGSVWLVGTNSLRSMEKDEVDLAVVLAENCYEIRDGRTYPKDQIEQKVAFDPALQFPGLVVFFVRPNGGVTSWLWGPGDLPAKYLNEPHEEIRDSYLNGWLMGDNSRLYRDLRDSRRLYPRMSFDEELAYALDHLYWGKMEAFVRKAVAAMSPEQQREFLAWAEVE
jgi:hypothetical protein